MQAFKIYSLILFSLASATAELEFSDCGDGEIQTIYADVCEKSPCSIAKEKPFTITIDFVPKHDAEEVKFSLSSVFFGAEFDLPVTNPDACDAGFVNCPLKAGEKASFKYEGKLENHVPAMSATILFRLKNSDENVLACAQTDIEIEDQHDEL